MRTTLLLIVTFVLSLLSLAADPVATGITGRWHFTYQTEDGVRNMDADLKLQGDQVSGKFNKAPVKGTFRGGVLDLAFPYDSDDANMTATLKMKGKLENDKLVGKWEFAEYDGSFVATRLMEK